MELLDYQAQQYATTFLPVFATLMESLRRWGTGGTPKQKGDNSESRKHAGVETRAAAQGKDSKGKGTKTQREEIDDMEEELLRAMGAEEDNSVGKKKGDAALPVGVRVAKQIMHKCEHFMSDESAPVRQLGVYAWRSLSCSRVFSE